MTLVENLHQARKDRLARMSANAVADIGIDLKRKNVCGSVPIKSNDELISDLRAQVTVLQEQLKGLVHSFQQPERIQPPEPESTLRPTVSAIKKVVAMHFGLSVLDLESGVRFGVIRNARHVAVYLCRRLTTCSWPQIGVRFGGRDHTTMIHSYRVVIDHRERDAEFSAMLDKLQQQIDPTGVAAA